MLDTKIELQSTLLTVSELLKSEHQDGAVEIIKLSDITCKISQWTGWNNEVPIYVLHIATPTYLFIRYKDQIHLIEEEIKNKLEVALKGQDLGIDNIYIIPRTQPNINWILIAGEFTKDELIKGVNQLQQMLSDAATFKIDINESNEKYVWLYIRINTALNKLNIDNPNKFQELWQWYHYYKNSNMGTYDLRRNFIKGLFKNLMDVLNEVAEPELLTIKVNLKGWERIERSIKEIKNRYDQSNTEEQFQSIGLLCRETIISLAQAVYNEDAYPPVDGIKPSKTDAKRMLEAYISVKLGGGNNERIRKYAKVTLDLANDLTHDRNAEFKDVALCSSATISLVNLVGIIEDRH